MKAILDDIRSGAKTQTIRLWKHRMMRSGQRSYIPGVGYIRMRVHERGVGETQSCGTGACAAAAGTRFWAGEGAPAQWLVCVALASVVLWFDELRKVGIRAFERRR